MFQNLTWMENYLRFELLRYRGINLFVKGRRHYGNFRLPMVHILEVAARMSHVPVFFGEPCWHDILIDAQKFRGMFSIGDLDLSNFWVIFRKFEQQWGGMELGYLDPDV